ncbi:MAG: hypothetical protein Q8M26_02810 [Pseudolabrys sp.]|nr:hypothetical protein [Pseudolabrys sp.]
MRILSYVLFALAIVAAGLGVLLYLYASGMGCAYSTGAVGGRCSFRPPWAMGYEDFLYTVAIPAGTVLLLALGGWACRRAG